MDRTEWVMVPREPTAQMLKAAADEDLKVWLDCGQPAADHSIIWRAMLATARTPVQDLQPVAWIDPGSYEAMLACEDGCLRYLTRHPREGDIPLYSTSPDAAARIAELEAERDRLRKTLNKYANPLNWTADENGIRRIWLEPSSATPGAHNGFENARAIIQKE